MKRAAATVAIRPAFIPEELPAIQTLLREYASEFGGDSCFQQFDEELATLPGAYAPPTGRLLLAWVGDQLAGCVALRSLGGERCEMKRLYVRPDYRGKGVGRLLARAILDEATQAGYRWMYLDTLPSMSEAIRLYRSQGFAVVEPYGDKPVPGAMCFARQLGSF